MAIHFSILGLIFLVSTFWEFRFTSYKKKKKNYIMSIFPWILVFGYITFLAAMRSGMNDTSVYIASFKRCSGTVQGALDAFVNSDIKFKFTNVLENIFKAFISKDYHMWFLFFAVIESVLFVRVFRRECMGIAIPCYFFFTSTLYYNYFSMMRQWMAVSITFGGYVYLRDKKWGKYILCCVLAAAFHPSAILCCVFAFLAQGKPWKSRQMIVIMLSSIGILLFNPILNSLESVTSGGVYDYVFDTMLTKSGSSPIRILITAVPVVLSYWSRQSIEREQNRTLNICVNISVLNFLLNIVAALTSGLFVIRLSVYLVPYCAILFSYLLNTNVRRKYRNLIRKGFYVMYFLLYCYQMQHQGAWGYNSDILGVFY